MEGNPITPISRVSPKKFRGLGDVVAAVAGPLATASDLLLNTDFKHCRGCGARREALNKLLPFDGK